MLAEVSAFVESGAFQGIKLSLLQFFGLDKDALHVHIGLAIFILVRLCWRWRGGWIVAWLCALAAALGGEWLDVKGHYAIGVPRPDNEHWHDIWNTMLWPTVLLCIGRWLQPKPEPQPQIVDIPGKSGDLADQTRYDSGEQAPPV